MVVVNIGCKNKLLEIRLGLGIKKQMDMAELLDINRSDYTQLENNRKRCYIETALKIAEKLDMKVEDIFYLDDED